MATKLTDSEFAERARAGNRKRADRRRERMANEGYQQLVVWIPAELKRQIAALATAEQVTTREIAVRLLAKELDRLSD
ncbi:MAG: hypothetical protein IPM11_01590 [Micropruina sp.]|nr:hypothetical protein [Micropruina sp.]